VLFYLLVVLGFVVARSPVRPSLSCCFNVFRPDRSLRLQIQLVNDDEQFTCYSPEGPTGATALLTVLEKAQSCIQERRRSMSRYGFGAIE
jgi:hypothetical protein